MHGQNHIKFVTGISAVNSPLTGINQAITVHLQQISNET